MVKVRYLGISNPAKEFQDLKPFRDRLIALGCMHRPSSAEYLLFQEVHQALDRACLHFTGDERFYYTGDTGGVGRTQK